MWERYRVLRGRRLRGLVRNAIADFLLAKHQTRLATNTGYELHSVLLKTRQMSVTSLFMQSLTLSILKLSLDSMH